MNLAKKGTGEGGRVGKSTVVRKLRETAQELGGGYQEHRKEWPVGGDPKA